MKNKSTTEFAQALHFVSKKSKRLEDAGEVIKLWSNRSDDRARVRTLFLQCYGSGGFAEVTASESSPVFKSHGRHHA